ncbi:MAG: hypothetical protein KatS3mg095_0753 [Candidatus Parcubacteria bacterium]|nr:MAG: hypothetical protein KatS3mg095_0753 [Candidatus Parcubacteria bacterium]
MKKKFLLFFISFIFFNIPYAVFSSNNCINYLAGFGNFEIGSYSQNIPLPEEIFLKGRNDKTNLLPTGWTLSNLSNIKDFKFTIDRSTSRDTNGNSYYLEINNTTKTLNNFSLYTSIWVSPDKISTETRDYYPKGGDNLNLRLTYRLDEIENVNLSISVVSRWMLNSGSIVSRTLISSPLNLSQQNFTNLEIATRVPFNNEISNNVEYLERIVIHINLNFVNNNQPKKLKLWLDNLDVYSFRNNECLKLPLERKNSSLKFAEVFSYRPDWNLAGDYDFIKLYLDNIKMTNTYRNIYLMNKQLDPEFKYTFYISPTTFHRYKKYNTTTENNKYNARQGLAEITTIFDDIQIATNTDVPHYSGNHIAYRIHPSAHYPEYISLRSDLVNYYNYPYRGTKYMIGVANHEPYFLDLVLKYFYKLDYIIFGKSTIAPDFYFIDNYNALSSAPAPNQGFKILKLNNYFKVADKNLYPLRKFFVNVGYSGLSPNSSFKKFGVKGYMNEGWLYNPESLNYPNSSATINSLFSSVIENKDLDSIFLVAGYPHYNIGGTATGPATTCTDTAPVIRSLVSSFYLVNNPNVYVALVPAGTRGGYDEDKYGPPQCYPQSMFINIGSPYDVDNVNQMIIGTTSDGWYVYERKYERGLVIFNSSPNFSYNYSIRWQNQPFQEYREYFTGNIYTTSSSNIITIPAKSGIILYNDGGLLLLP